MTWEAANEACNGTDPSPGAVPKACEQLMEAGARLQMAYAWFPQPGEPAEVIYLADKRAQNPLLCCDAALRARRSHWSRWRHAFRYWAGTRGK